ncbi:MAG: tetratricopeptide repeat protein [Rhodobacteraceae bacterium]|nr:tetratricopeptide repeat protein [Paracoccaceae bacterium]
MRFANILLILTLQFFATMAAADAGNVVEDTELRLDELFSQLRDADVENVYDIEWEIIDIWVHSGSAAMDLLLRRGQIAIEDQDYPKALEHLSALIDHAPEFAEGWNARATVYYLTDEYALAISDITQALILNPRHFGALNGLGLIFEELDNPKGAYKAYTMVRDLHPHFDNVNEALIALRPLIDGVEL